MNFKLMGITPVRDITLGDFQGTELLQLTYFSPVLRYAEYWYPVFQLAGDDRQTFLPVAGIVWINPFACIIENS